MQEHQKMHDIAAQYGNTMGKTVLPYSMEDFSRIKSALIAKPGFLNIKKAIVAGRPFARQWVEEEVSEYIHKGVVGDLPLGQQPRGTIEEEYQKLARTGKKRRIERYNAIHREQTGVDALELGIRSLFDHWHALGRQADFLAEYCGLTLTEAEQHRIALGAPVHDVAELYVGDVPMFHADNKVTAPFENAHEEKIFGEVVANLLIEESLPEVLRAEFRQTIEALFEETRVRRFFDIIDKMDYFFGTWRYFLSQGPKEKSPGFAQHFFTAFADTFDNRYNVPATFCPMAEDCMQKDKIMLIHHFWDSFRSRELAEKIYFAPEQVGLMLAREEFSEKLHALLHDHPMHHVHI